jgi:uncharacterized protein YndB with AHSA1/START domain
VASNDYEFVTHWRIEGTVEEVFDVLDDPAQLARWWPAVYLETELLESGDERHVGRVVRMFSKGWLPYTIRWQLTVTASQRPDGFSIAAAGDFDGTGVWTFRQDGSFVDVTFDWRIKAENPLLRYLSPVMKPIFAANHRWAMARGEESLNLELARRRATTPAERDHVPAPPGPTFPHNRRPRGAAGVQTTA